MGQTATRQQPKSPPLQTPTEVFAEEDLGFADERSLFLHLSSLWKARRVLRQAAIAGMFAGTLLAFALPTQYESKTQLMPPDNQSSSGIAMLAAMSAKTGGLFGPMAGDLLGVKSSGALFVGILRSQTVEDRLVDRFELRRVYGIRYEQDARIKLAEKTAISEDRKTGIISITVTDHDPKRAAAIAHAYVEELNQLVAELSTSSAHRERVFLEERLTSVKSDLDQASRDFSQFASKNKTIDLKEEARAMLQGAATIEGELIAAESELKGLQAIYTENNVRVRSVQARISELRHQLEKLGGGSSGKSSLQTDSADSTHPSLRNLPLLGVTYADLYRRVQIQEAVYETLTQQFELAKVQEAKETPSVKVLDPAIIPEHKSFPPRLLIVSLCATFAVVAASMFVLGRERWAATDQAEPGKVLAREMYQTLNAKMPWAAPNGSQLQAWTHRIWIKFAAQNGSSGKRASDHEMPRI